MSIVTEDSYCSICKLTKRVPFHRGGPEVIRDDRVTLLGASAGSPHVIPNTKLCHWDGAKGSVAD